MTERYNTEIASQIRKFLDNTDYEWFYRFDEEKGLFDFFMNLETQFRVLQYVIIVHKDNYNVYATFPICVPAEDSEKMLRMAEFICRANYGLVNGNFELDFTLGEGELRFKTYVNCEDILPSDKTIRDSIICPAAMFAHYYNGIMRLLFNDISVEEAIEEYKKGDEDIESDDDDEESLPYRVQTFLRILQNESEISIDEDLEEIQPNTSGE